MPMLRVLDHVTRQMQRMGYLKRLIRRVIATSTSNLDNLGKDLVDTVSRRISIPLNEPRAHYIKVRLYDQAYATLKKQTNDFLRNGGEPPIVAMELQDLYLADPTLQSGVGKLIKGDWRKYPPLGVTIGLIRAGTYSANTRALSLLYFTPEIEQKAFAEYLPEANPFRLTRHQSLLLMYSFLENDGEVVSPLWQSLATKYSLSTFNDREVGNLLPEIYQTIITRYRARSISADLRERLEVIEKSAEFIARARQSEKYSGGSAREESSRVRVEPYADIGIFRKPDPLKYEYAFSSAGLVWSQAIGTVISSSDVESFLHNEFFHTAANAWEIDAPTISNQETLIPYLRRAAKAINSPGGYAPIEELALVAGIEALIDDHHRFEIAAAREALIAYQKANPYQLRFTVDRLGSLAHVRFMDETAS